MRAAQVTCGNRSAVAQGQLVRTRWPVVCLLTATAPLPQQTADVFGFWTSEGGSPGVIGHRSRADPYKGCLPYAADHSFQAWYRTPPVPLSRELRFARD
jgi:hypothetical protein